jgi:hypothetical protein
MGVESSTKCLSLSVWKQSVCVCLERLFVQILVVKEFACLDITSCNKLNEKIYCLISFFANSLTLVGIYIYQNQSMMPLSKSNITPIPILRAKIWDAMYVE